MTQKYKFWQVDAFTNQPFKGNPAAVFVLKEELEDQFMQNIAIEMNLSETAFVLLREDGQKPLLRWFTPTIEIDLCGHATLASSHVLMSKVFPDQNEIVFDTKFAGTLQVSRNKHGYTMNFPSRLGDKIRCDEIPSFVLEALDESKPIDAYKSRDLMLVYEDEKTIREITPDFNSLKNYQDFIIVTAKSNDTKYDFVSRFFCADDGITEDPVTGSAHCTLTPYWANKLGKKKLTAYQASQRGGELGLEVSDDRILMTGQALTLIEGILQI
jgi:PhzF family phenazine biosynthesis protein